MPTDQYYEPPEELSQETRTFARVITSLTEEAEAIGWYQQRLSLEKDQEAKDIMAEAQREEMRHFSMDLEFLLRRLPEWREAIEGIVGKTGPIVDSDAKLDEAHAKAEKAGPKSVSSKPDLKI